MVCLGRNLDEEEEEDERQTLHCGGGGTERINELIGLPILTADAAAAV